MFSSKSVNYFIVSALLTTTSLVLMAIDAEPNGFGLLTLWVAPPILLIGLALPIPGILAIDRSVRIWPRLSWKNLFALASFLIAFGIYIYTLEPTASLWDCSEFIASSYKLQVPHTPGTPLSLLFGRIFSMLAPDVIYVAWMVNVMSAFFSALSVVLVFFIIYHFGEKIFIGNGAWPKIILTGGAFTGSLCLAFSDTFWFSAVEAETYGGACFVLLLLLWMILKGAEAEEPFRSRMFILIAYVSGLGYCIHPMCLLVLPALPFAWYVKTTKIKSIVTSLLFGMLVVFLINRFVAIGIFDLAFVFDLVAVNTLHLPFYSGVIILLVMAIAIVYFLLRKFPKYKLYSWAIVFLVLGFTPYVMLFVRSNQNPPIDETNPENLYQIKAYFNRDSYGSSPLVFGPYFDARIDDVTPRGKAYYKDAAAYKIGGTKVDYQYESSRVTILPRIYSRDDNHILAYREWLGLSANEKPDFGDNLKFMFTYQLGHMYLRYFMWNFVGRESDVQNSAWLKPWDRLSEGSSERSRNQYWMIPLLIGVFGAMLQYWNDRRSFIVNGIFFLFTGIVLAFYLNSPPIEPRERDYIYVGSYIAYCIWIGLGVIAVCMTLLRYKLQLPAMIFALALPLWIFYQNFDDHNRAGRTFQIDYARAVLNNCAPNAVLFTGGDNDTFPLWYLQEVEGFRTDVRVVVLSYFNTDWYIDQLRRPYYNSAPLNFTLTQKDYRQYGKNDVLYLDEQVKQGIDVHQYLKLIKEEHVALRRQANDGDYYHILPSRILKLTYKQDPTQTLSFAVPGNFLEKNALTILDLIASNDWQRPFYFNFTSMNTLSMDIKPYLVQEGLIYRLTPQRSTGDLAVNTAVSYQNLVEKADFTNLADPTVNFNYEEYYSRMIVPLRQSFNALAAACLKEGNEPLAEKVLNASIEKLHYPHLPPSFTDLHTAQMLLAIGQEEKAKLLSTSTFDYYYNQVSQQMKRDEHPDNFDLYALRQSTALLTNLGESSYVSKFSLLGL
ncbi:glycosyltransferase family 117 protein [Pseudochryseolinea flava]|uniref:DUF2723 domain-containing protein n=1 Tax=Pseudochryseolinea flava TaxID=2059302 RepID=A0A364Y326_9BACT|nr:DUF2723 domain-containing protein [Pseudochryseolinea flava]RAW00380.1 DUF2723 domain-containing protein [Pseudochryseolinea flava]